MKDHIEDLIAKALDALADDVVPREALPAKPPVERARDPKHGDFATNVALALAKAAGRPPRELAQLVVEHLPASDKVSGVEIAGPGFINFRVAADAFHRIVGEVLDAGAGFGRAAPGTGERVLVEFVSANPTGPLHVGHGRLAAYGDSVANVLEAAGHEVHREYYVNDAGRQMDILAVSVWLRYLEGLGETVHFPANGYRGTYVSDIAATLRAAEGERLVRTADELADGLPPDAPDGDKEAHIDALIARARERLGGQDYALLHEHAHQAILEEIREDLVAFGVSFDQWFSERRLHTEGLIDHALEKLRAAGNVYRRDGAEWLRASAFGDEKDRVVVRENGQTTYFASDIAYHLGKRERGHELLLDVLGADHHGYVARVRAGLAALGEPPDCLEVRLVQFVALYRGGEKVQMSTRSGQFVTLRDLREEVGNDAARFFYVMRSNDQHLDFDLELAASQSKTNPVYYVQYAHARICSVFAKLAERGLGWAPDDALDGLELLAAEHERALMTLLGRYPETVLAAARNRAPQQIANYLRELATALHGYYDFPYPILVDEQPLRDARLALVAAVSQVLANGLALLGVSAPERMESDER